MLRLLALMALCLLAALPAEADVLTAIAPDALVVVGDNAPPEERAAAADLAARLNAVVPGRDFIISASKANTDLEIAATHHLLVVGTPASNRVMGRFPSHWAMDRDAYYADHPVFPAYTPTHGYYVAGFGTFPAGDVGYVECDRNPYWEYATNLGITPSGNTPIAPDLPYRQIIRFTGNTPAGVALAVKAFLGSAVLTGIATPDNRLPGPMSLWSLDTDHFALPGQAPPWIPRGRLVDGPGTLDFAGWQIADSMIYAGFQDASGAAARSIWRAKYLTEKGLNYPMNVVIDPAHPMTRSPLFEASLARRATGNEFFIAQLSTPAEAQQALKGIQATLNKRGENSHAPWTDIGFSNTTWHRSRFGTTIAVFDRFLIMESFDDDHAPMAVKALSENCAKLTTTPGGEK